MSSRRLLLLSSLIVGMALSMSALPVSYYASQSRLSQGRWVKISTADEQIYQLSYEHLRELGFEHPERVQVFGYPSTYLNEINHRFSESYSDDLTPIATRHTDDGRILFFGGSDHTVISGTSTAGTGSSAPSIRRNYYDTASHYFLTEVDEVQPVYSRPVATIHEGYPVSESHIHIDIIEEELQSYNEGGCSVHGKKYQAGDHVPFTFTIRDYHPGDGIPCGSFFYRFAINSTATTKLSVTQSPGLSTPSIVTTDYFPNTPASAINDSQIDIAYNDATGYMPFDAPANGSLADGNYTFTVNIPSANKLKYCAADHAILRYPRLNRLHASDPSMVMNLAKDTSLPGRRIEFPEAADGHLEVWNIDCPDAYESLPVTYDADINSSHVVLRDATTRLVAFDPTAAFPEPQIIGEVASQNLHGAATPQMLIITTAELEPLAQRLADAHARHGLDVMVVRHDLIYNEFTSGNRHPMAYRRMAKMFYDRDPERFHYLMFFGPAHYDARCLFSPAADRMVPYMQDNPDFSRSTIFNYATDNYFAMLGDDYDHSRIHFMPYDIAVGRVSAISGAQASVYVDKAIRLLDNPIDPDTYSRVLLLSGQGDRALHSSHSKEVLTAMQSRNSMLNFVAVPEELYPKDTPDLQVRLIGQALKNGCGYMTYSGHGGMNFIQMWNTNTVNATRYNHPTFVMFSSCDQFAFDRMRNGLLEVMMFQAGGGAIGGVGADRSVYINYNQLSCLPTAQAYAQARPGDTFGDIYMAARRIGLDIYNNSSNMSHTPLRNMLSYNLAGDPALPVGVPEMTARFDRISDQTVSDGMVTIEPLKPATFTGLITDEAGNAAEAFNGSVRITVFDGSHDAETNSYGKEDNYKPESFTITSDVLTVCDADVTNGRFSTEFTLPLPAYAADSYRIAISAIDNEGKGAAGSFDGLRIADFDYTDPDMAEFAAPQIKSFSVGDITTRPGVETTSSTTVYAVIDPSSSGLRFQNGDVNSRTRLTIDNLTQVNNLEAYLRRRDDGYFELAAPVSGLADGSHTLLLQVANNAGVIDKQTLEFVVVTRSIDVELAVAEEPARTSATIDTSSAATFDRLVITDSEGHTVHTATNPTFPYEWNLCDAAGKPCPDGLYKASVLLHSDRSFGNSAATPIVILRDKQ